MSEKKCCYSQTASPFSSVITQLHFWQHFTRSLASQLAKQLTTGHRRRSCLAAMFSQFNYLNDLFNTLFIHFRSSLPLRVLTSTMSAYQRHCRLKKHNSVQGRETQNFRHFSCKCRGKKTKIKVLNLLEKNSEIP